MTRKRDIRSYTAAELSALRARGRSHTDWRKADRQSEKALEQAIAADPEERWLQPDWTTAKLVLPQAKQSVHLRLDRDVIAFFKGQGRGHLTRMQAVLRAYVDAQKRGPVR